MGKRGERYSPRFQFQTVLEVLEGDREAVEITRAHNLHPTTVARWKKEVLENSTAIHRASQVAIAKLKMSTFLRLLNRKANSFRQA